MKQNFSGEKLGALSRAIVARIEDHKRIVLRADTVVVVIVIG